jgi:hypothetical protein
MFQEACEWVGSSDRSWLFSFENICDTLEINADYVRRGLRLWKERGPQARAAVKVEAIREDPEQSFAIG